MKKFLVVLAVATSSFGFGQTYNPEFYLGKLFYDSITNDQFLVKQKYANFVCESFSDNIQSDMLKVDPAIWVYKQDFSQYFDTTKFLIVYEAIAYDNGFHFEYIMIYNIARDQLVRQLMASYDYNSNQLISIMDSNIGW
jgi:hypothetical protein